MIYLGKERNPLAKGLWNLQGPTRPFGDIKSVKVLAIAGFERSNTGSRTQFRSFSKDQQMNV